MFENLSDRLNDTFRNLTGRGSLTEKNIEDAMREVRLALLEADVNYKIVKEFITDVKEKCLGERVLKSVSPGQQAIKVVSDSLERLMGETNAPLNFVSKPSVILMVGLHGSGKTTTTAKLAYHLGKDGKRVLMVAADLYRPAAIDQLETLGHEHSIPVHSDRASNDLSSIVCDAIKVAVGSKKDVVIVDTAGRLEINQDLIGELVDLKNKSNPDEILLVADAALGQEAVSVATHFNDALDITGIILTKMDGDARGGAALSMREVTGEPIKFIGVGEKVEDLEVFYPDRMASRILGMGDVVSLVEKAAETISEDEAKRLEEKMLKNRFDFDDFFNQLQHLKKLGGMSKVLDFIPGGRKMMQGVDVDDGMLKHTEAVLSSMTAEERRRPGILNSNSRRERIAKGCGRPLVEVQQLIKRFDTMKGMMSKMGKMSNVFGAGGPEMAGEFGPGLNSGRQAKTLSQKQKKAKRKKNKQKRKKR